jgi:hypothetical protein
MFEKLMATAVLPASDIGRARNWWRDVLGRDPVYEDAEGEALFYDIGGTMLMVYRSDYAGTARNTAFNLVTDNLDRDMTELRTHGVMFHDYDMPGLKTDREERGAWFSDSEGNIIAIGEVSPQMREMAARIRGSAAGMG